MRRTVFSVVLLTLILFGGTQVAGQESAGETPTPGELPPGVAVSILAERAFGPLPQAPAWVGLARFTFQAGAQFSDVAPGPTLFIMDTGSIAFELGDGQAADSATPAGERPALGPGEQFYVPTNSSYSTSNATGSSATALRVVTYPSAPMVPPSVGVSYQILTGGVVESLPTGPAIATVARVSLATGADVSTSTEGEDGPILLYIESGLVNLEVPGAQAVLSPGGTALIQSGNETATHNAGGRPVLFLALAIRSAPSDDEAGTPVT